MRHFVQTLSKTSAPKASGVLCLLLWVLMYTSALAGGVPHGDLGSRASRPAFEENKGQVYGADAHKVKYIYKQGHLTLFLTEQGLAYQFHRHHYPEDYQRPNKITVLSGRPFPYHSDDDIRLETYRMDMTLVDAAPQPRISVEGQSRDYVHYFPADATYVHSYQKVTYHDVYPHIDWVIAIQEGALKYDFVVHPGGDPSQIRMKIRWAEQLAVGEDGSLILTNRMGAIMEKPPVSYQQGKEIPTRFILERDEVRFDVAAYDPLQALLIDPELLWATYYGNEGFDDVCGLVTDAWGFVYIAGGTDSQNFIAEGGHQNTIGGFDDAFLAKFDLTGKRIWATYFGGKGSESGWDCTLDPNGNLYLTGVASFNNSMTMTAHQSHHGGERDAFLAKFNSAGEFLWSTYFGGKKTDSGTSCVTDAEGNVYLTGATNSVDNIFHQGFQDSLYFGADAFLAKFSPDGTLLWSTYYGGEDEEYSSSCVTDAYGNVYMSGGTYSSENISHEGHQMANGGGYDAYLVKFNAQGERLWATFYGGSALDLGGKCAVDNENNVYLAGATTSEQDIAYNGHSNSLNDGMDAFLVKFTPDGQRIWATYYGGEGGESASVCVVDAANNVYLTGYTGSLNDIVHNGHQSSLAGKQDGFLVKFDPQGNRLWASYYGGPSYEVIYANAVDVFGNIYIAGETFSETQISLNGFQNVKGRYADGFLAKFHSGCTPPAPPSGEALQQFCDGASVADLHAQGATIRWYSSPEGGVPLHPNTPLVHGALYYASHIDEACESTSRLVVTAQLTQIDPGLHAEGSTLTAQQEGALYQWLNCDQDFQPVAGAQDQSFSPPTSGNYAVAVEWQGCRDTSDCVYVLTTGMGSFDPARVRIFPNPTRDFLYIALPEDMELEFLSLTGQRLLWLPARPLHEVDIAHYPPGIYYLKARQFTFKIVKH